jgi:hypothetical protein
MIMGALHRRKIIFPLATCPNNLRDIRRYLEGQISFGAIPIALQRNSLVSLLDAVPGRQGR